MENLSSVIDKIKERLDEKELLRETALKSCRNIIRLCRKSIQKTYENSTNDAEKNMEQGLIELNELLDDIPDEHDDILHAGFMENMFQEVVEATCLLRITNDKKILDPDELRVTYSSYLLGLGDLVGELRRFALDRLIQGDTDAAREYLQKMEEIYGSIIRFDYPSGFIPLKKKQDVARNLIEKTKGELSVAVCEGRMSEKIGELQAMLGEKKEGKTEITNENEKKNLDLDIDEVW